MFRERLLFYFILTILVTANIEENQDKSLFGSKIDISSARTTSQTSYKHPDAKHRARLLGKVDSTKHHRLVPTTSSSTESTTCITIPAISINICPPNFKLIPHGNENICYIIIENQSYPPSCPYPNFLPYHRIKNYLQKDFVDKVIWVHAYRDTKSGFPDFEWVENGQYNGNISIENLTNPNDVKDKNCIASIRGHLHRVSCSSDTISSLCMYSIDHLHNLYLSILCDSPNYTQCTFGHYDLTRPTCFCKKIDGSQPPRRQFCEKLAEPTFPFQSELMTQYFGLDSSRCWIGLYKEDLDPGVNYKWLSTDTKVEYTRWARPEGCTFTEGAFKFNSPPYGGWQLFRDRTLNCSICEFTKLLNECTLELRYVENKNEVELIITNYMSISTSRGFNLYCFSDSNNDGFKQPVAFNGGQIKQSGISAKMKLETISDHPSYYWCEAFQYFSNTTVKSNKLVAYNRHPGYGNEFSIHVNVEISKGIDPFLNKKHLEVLKHIYEKINKLKSSVQYLRPMRANFDEKHRCMYMLVHLTTRRTGESATQQFEKFSIPLYSMSADYPFINVTEFLGSEVCLPSTTKTPDEQILEWPETRIGENAIPYNILCLDESKGMVPVTRKCEGNFLTGAKWANMVGTCNKNTTYSETTRELFDLVHSKAPAENITTELTRITRQNVNNQPIDVHFMSSVLERLAVEFKGKVDTPSFSTIVSNMLHFDKEVVKEAQSLLNSTDQILSTLDDFLNSQESKFVVTPKLVVQISTLETNIRGLALYNNESDSSFESYTITPVFQNTSFNNLIKDKDLETAVVVPIDDLKISSSERAKLIIAIFYNDLLFNERDLNVSQKIRTKIISVSISGFIGSLDSSIRMAFRLPKNYSDHKNCSYWNYGLDTNMVSVHGKWETERLSQEYTNLLEICEFSHMTHFGLLLQGEGDLIEDGVYKRSLEILIVVGSALSLIGVLPIFFTACLFRSWRCRSGNIILLNFCIAITGQIILTFLLFNVEEDGTYCTILGATLHYTDLSEFCWMFIIALLQYRRFVTVFRPQQERLVGKCIFFGWIAPVLPVLITICISTDNYRINSAGYCYAVDNYFIYACLVPICIILCVNAFIFVAIMYSISKQSSESRLQRSHNYKLEILLALFLFFTLGMTWIFCFAGMLGGGIAFTYLFCATSTLRGLVLFLFFILGNKEIRQLWMKRFSYYVNTERRESGGVKGSNTGTMSSDSR